MIRGSSVLIRSNGNADRFLTEASLPKNKVGAASAAAQSCSFILNLSLSLNFPLTETLIYARCCRSHYRLTKHRSEGRHANFLFHVGASPPFGSDNACRGSASTAHTRFLPTSDSEAAAVGFLMLRQQLGPSSSRQEGFPEVIYDTAQLPGSL